MAVRKIAISVPEDVLRNVDRIAKREKTTRSALIARVLKQVAKAADEYEMINQINQLFEDPDVSDEQLATANLFLHSPKRGYGSSEW